MTRVNRIVRGKRPQFHDSQALDEALSMIMVLAQELAVVRERLDTFERVADQDGDLRARIEAFPLDEAVLAERETWRRDLLDALFYLPRQNAHDARSGQTLEKFRTDVAEIETPA